MADPENHTVRLLREIRAALQALDDKVESGQVDVRSRLESLRQTVTGESVLGRYAAAEVDERLDAIEKRLSALEKAD